MLKSVVVFAIVAISVSQQSWISRRIATYHRLEHGVKRAVHEGRSHLEEALDEVKRTAAAFEQEAYEEVGILLNKHTLLAIKVAALHAEKCKSAVNDLRHVSGRFRHSLEDCFKNPVVKAEALFKDALDNVKKLEHDFTHIIKHIHECKGHLFKTVACDVKLVEGTVKDIERVPHRIVEDAVKEAALIRKLVPDILACVETQLAKATENLAEEIGKLEHCANHA